MYDVDFEAYEAHREMLMAVYALVEREAQKNGVVTDWDADDVDTICIGAFKWCNEVVSVKCEDPEAKGLKLTMLTGNGVICGEMQVSNLPIHVVVSAIVDHLGLTV